MFMIVLYHFCSGAMHCAATDYHLYIFCILGNQKLEILKPETALICIRELLQEPNVILEEQPQVLDAETQHGDTLDAHAECEA